LFVGGASCHTVCGRGKLSLSAIAIKCDGIAVVLTRGTTSVRETTSGIGMSAMKCFRCRVGTGSGQIKMIDATIATILGT